MSGLVGGRGDDGVRLIGVANRSKQILKTAVSPKKIAMYILNFLLQEAL